VAQVSDFSLCTQVAGGRQRMPSGYAHAHRTACAAALHWGIQVRLLVPSPAPAPKLLDIHGRPIAIGDTGRRTLLAFFRDAACPFGNFRIHELTHHHASLSALGLDIVAVFAPTPNEVRRFVARQPRPLRIVADPQSRAYAL
jgi:peroxiredoxin